MRDLPGVLALDLPRYLRALAYSRNGDGNHGHGWTSLCNRIERLTVNPEGPGVTCEWQWASNLHAADVWPVLGRWVMRNALTEWPIEFMNTPRWGPAAPQVSFVFAHAGAERLTQLKRTIRSIFAQEDVACECVVVDQTPTAIQPQLPQSVVYRHLAKTDVAPGWHKAWAYNVGARIASSEILVFHDGDVCAPRNYALEVVRAIRERSFDAASVQRFLFYLDHRATRSIEAADTVPMNVTPASVVQNWKGGTIAIRREAFFSIGGFDEGFVDWGGEDDEFYDRCSVLRHCRYGYIPFVHLWHPPQPDRKRTDNLNITTVMPWRMSRPHQARIEELMRRRFGHVSSPDPGLGYKSRDDLPWK